MWCGVVWCGLVWSGLVVVRVLFIFFFSPVLHHTTPLDYTTPHHHTITPLTPPYLTLLLHCSSSTLHHPHPLQTTIIWDASSGKCTQQFAFHNGWLLWLLGEGGEEKENEKKKKERKKENEEKKEKEKEEEEEKEEKEEEEEKEEKNA